MRLRHRFPVLSVTVLALMAVSVAFAGATQTPGALARDGETNAGFALAMQTTPQPGSEASGTPTLTPTSTPDTTPTQTPIPTSTPNLTGEMEPCTFTAARAINLRTGPGTGFKVTAVLGGGESIDVIGQKTGADGFVWWDVGDAWARSDLGENDCASLCGNTVCESGESNDTCPQDCWAPAPTRTAASTSVSEPADTSSTCYASDCDACYRSISCYPDCSECTCSKNSFGCSTCYCRYPASSQSQSTGTTSTTSGTTTESRTCDFASCAACIAAFPCTPGPCGTTQCTLNEFGCPECTTAP